MFAACVSHTVCVKHRMCVCASVPATPCVCVCQSVRVCVCVCPPPQRPTPEGGLPPAPAPSPHKRRSEGRVVQFATDCELTSPTEEPTFVRPFSLPSLPLLDDDLAGASEADERNIALAVSRICQVRVCVCVRAFVSV